MPTSATLSPPPDARAAAPNLGSAIVAKLDELARLTDEPGWLTRLYLSPSHRAAVDLVGRWMTAAGMAIRLDGTGTLIGRYAGQDPMTRTLLVGSHIDTVRRAGRFDGTLGVLTAIEVVAAFHRRGRRFPFAIEVVAFGDEEGVRFPSTLGGSRAMAGRFDPQWLDERDADGISRREALAAFGCDAATIPAAARKPEEILGYVEVHIEQGPVLEADGLALGIVTAINGASRGTVEILGEAGHAGTVPMALRHDALAAAAEMILMIEQRARSQAGLVATVGRLETPGGAVNTVPGKVAFSLDMRASSDEQRQRTASDIEAAIRAIAEARGCEARIHMGYDAPAAACDTRLVTALEQAAARRGERTVRLASGAGHDGMAFRGILPFAMLFVRCRRGVSHHPDEFTSSADIDAAARVLFDFIDHFDPTPPGDQP
jgi:allantoate deiminase